MSEARQGMLQVLKLKNGARLHYGEAGSGLPLILVHGPPGCAATPMAEI
jgi:pimeloyl-ACP methyl ester carboxylesterase